MLESFRPGAPAPTAAQIGCAATASQCNWRLRLHSFTALQRTPTTAPRLTNADVGGLIDSPAPGLNHANEATPAPLQKVPEERSTTPAAAAPVAGDPSLAPPAGEQKGSRDPASAAGRAAARDFHPQKVLESLEGALTWQDRARVLEDFHQTLLCIPVTESWPHMSEVLLILNRMLTDTNFKITLTTLYIINDLVDKWSSNMITVAGAVVPGLIEKLGDNKIVIRQTTMKIFYKIFSAVGRVGSPHPYGEKLLKSLASSLVHRSAHVRLELLGVVIMALLVFKQCSVPYDHDHILQVTCQALKDPNERVCMLALEALAVLQRGAEEAALEERVAAALQDNNTLLNKAITRLADSSLPTVTEEGLVEFPTWHNQALDDRASPIPYSESPPSALPARPFPIAAMALGKLGKRMMAEDLPAQGAPHPPSEAVPKRPGRLSGPAGEYENLGPRARSAHVAQREDCSIDESLSLRVPARAGILRTVGSASSSSSNADRIAPSQDSGSEERQRRQFLGGGAGSKVSFAEPEEIFQEVPSPKSPPSPFTRGRRSAPLQSVRLIPRWEPSDDAAVPGSSGGKGGDWNLGGLQDVEVEESPNYIPNWLPGGGRPVTRPACCLESQPLQHGAAAASGVPLGSAMAHAAGFLEDLDSHSPTNAEHARGGSVSFTGMQERECAGNLIPDEPPSAPAAEASTAMPAPHDMITDKLRLLKRPAGRRAASQSGSRHCPATGALRAVLAEGDPPTPMPFTSEGSPRSSLDDLEISEVTGGNEAMEGQTTAPTASRRTPAITTAGVTRQPEDDANPTGKRRMSLPLQSSSSASRLSSALQLGSVLREPSSSSLPEVRSNPRRPRAVDKKVEDGAIVYLDGKDLPLFDRAPSERWVEDVFGRLGSASAWNVQFEALTDLRRVAKHAPRLLGRPTSLRDAVVLVAGLADSLRSAVAKGALMCLHDLFLAYGKQMDVGLDRIAPLCLKKAADTNGFLCSEAERALVALCQNVTEARGLAALLTMAADQRLCKNPKLKAKCVWCLGLLIPRLGSCIALAGSKNLRNSNFDVDRLMGYLARVLQDASADVRSMARLAVIAFRVAADSAADFERVVARSLSSADAAMVRRTVESAPKAEAAGQGRAAAGGDQPPTMRRTPSWLPSDRSCGGSAVAPAAAPARRSHEAFAVT